MLEALAASDKSLGCPCTLEMCNCFVSTGSAEPFFKRDGEIPRDFFQVSAAVQRLCSSNPRTIAELAQLRSVCLEGGVGFQVQVEVCGVLRMQRSEALHLVGPRSDNLASVSGGWWRVRPHDFAKAFVPGGLRCVQILSISSHESSSFLVRCAAVCILKLIFAVFGLLYF